MECINIQAVYFIENVVVTNKEVACQHTVAVEVAYHLDALCGSESCLETKNFHFSDGDQISAVPEGVSALVWAHRSGEGG